MGAFFQWILKQATRGVLGQIIKSVLESLGVWQFVVAVPIAVSVGVKAMIEGSQAVSFALMLGVTAAVVVLLHYVALSYEGIRKTYFGGGLATDDLPVQRDVWLSDAMIYVLRGKWGDRIDPTTISGNELNRFYEIEKDFRQASLDGKLPIWGKQVAHGLWEEVLAEDWASYDFSEFDLLESLADPEKLIVLRIGGQFPTQEWVRVMTSKARVEELWPV